MLTGKYSNSQVGQLRALVAAALDGSRAVVDTAHDFVPHITIAYAPIDIEQEHVGEFSHPCGSIFLVRGGDYARLHSRQFAAPASPEIFSSIHRNPIPSGRPLTDDEFRDLRAGQNAD